MCSWALQPNRLTFSFDILEGSLRPVPHHPLSSWGDVFFLTAPTPISCFYRIFKSLCTLLLCDCPPVTHSLPSPLFTGEVSFTKVVVSTTDLGLIVGGSRGFTAQTRQPKSGLGINLLVALHCSTGHPPSHLYRLAIALWQIIPKHSGHNSVH